MDGIGTSISGDCGETITDTCDDDDAWEGDDLSSLCLGFDGLDPEVNPGLLAHSFGFGDVAITVGDCTVTISEDGNVGVFSCSILAVTVTSHEPLQGVTLEGTWREAGFGEPDC